MKQELQTVVPRHVAIIPDGNRRWARKNGLQSFAGHKKAGSYENLVSLLETAREIGVKHISFWAFSTDNWKRSNKEINLLFDLLLKSLKKFRNYLEENKIRFRHFGRKDRLPEEMVQELEKLENSTSEFDNMGVQFCLDYGGRDELIRAVKKLKKLEKEEITEEDFINCLDSVNVPDPDLIIRTSGEKRMSGFMPFQSAYAELYFVEKNFPDFEPEDLKKVVGEFATRTRRFGK